MEKWIHFDNKIHGQGDLEYDIKIKDIVNLFKKKINVRFNFVKYILPINQDNSIPTVFSWNLGGTFVNVSGDWDNWIHQIPLNRSGNEFTTIIPLSPGSFQYKFVVDGQIKYAPNHKIKRSLNGQICNITNIQQFEKSLELEDSFSENENLNNTENYKTNSALIEDRKDPPLVPLHLASLLETKLINKNHYYHRSFLNLPTRIHVFLNHLFFLSFEKIATQLKQKFPASRSRINGKTINVIFCSGIKKVEFRLNHPLKKYF